MVDVCVKEFTIVKVHTRATGNRRLFWVRMYDVQEGLGVKNISDLVRKKIMVFLRLKNLQMNKLENTKDLEKNGLLMIFILMFVLISF